MPSDHHMFPKYLKGRYSQIRAKVKKVTLFLIRHTFT
jgi:hypothetical protein